MQQPPTGELALVFTDIEGSTALWERLGDAFAPVLEVHNRVMREALQAHGGYEVKTEGDAFVVAFPSADAALGFCHRAQLQLAETPWPAALSPDTGTPPQLWVRMGMHVGAPVARPDPTHGRMDYFGPVVNRAARVAAAAHGGQILASGAARQRLTGRDAAALDLGWFRLKGLEQPERLWQVLPERLAERQFPPPRTEPWLRGHLPERSDAFVGRTDLLARLDQQLAAGSRMVTLLGAGGMGKTRLSQQWARIVQNDFPGGVWFCDLAAATDRAGLVSAVATVLQVPLGKGSPIEALGGALRGRGRLLLVLDNLEQVATVATEAIVAWLQAAPDLVVLGTSRVRLGLSAERLVEVLPLSIEEGVALFVERARTAVPGFVLRDDDKARVGRLVRHLDGLALAIELAAARVRVLSVAQLIERIDQRLDLLRSSRRDAVDRQASLRSLIDWSWQLLSGPARTAMAQAALFRGGFALREAEEVIVLDEGSTASNDGGDTLAALDELIDHSLLRSWTTPQGHVRFGMYESIREYGLSRLRAQGQEAATRLRLVRCFASWGRPARLDRLDGADGMDELVVRSSERQNLLQAVPWAVEADALEAAAECVLAVEPVYEVEGPLPDAMALLTSALAWHPLPPLLRARLLRAHGRVLRLGGRPEDGLVSLLKANELVAALPVTVDTAAESARLLMAIGMSHLSAGRVDEPRALFNDCLTFARSHHLTSLEGQALERLAFLSNRQADPLTALALGDEALAIFSRMGATRLMAGLQVNRGSALSSLARYAEAEETLQAAMLTCRSIGNRLDEGRALNWLGNLVAELGRLDEAADLYGQSIRIFREFGYVQPLCGALICLGDLELVMGNLDEAERLLLEGIAIAEAAFTPNAATGRCSLGVVRACQGRWSEGCRMLDDSLPLLHGKNDSDFLVLTARRAMIAWIQGDPEEAEALRNETNQLDERYALPPAREAGRTVALLREVFADPAPWRQRTDVDALAQFLLRTRLPPAHPAP